MVAIIDTCRKQKVVIKLAFLGGESTANIQRKLVNIYGETALVIRIRKWVSQVNSNHREKGEIDLSQSTHPQW